jgi:hypothetical protein
MPRAPPLTWASPSATSLKVGGTISGKCTYVNTEVKEEEEEVKGKEGSTDRVTLDLHLVSTALLKSMLLTPDFYSVLPFPSSLPPSSL